MPGQDMTWYSGDKHLEDESLKSKFRDFKLTLLQNNFEFKVDTKKLEVFKKSNAYKALIYYPNEVLSGSISLYLHGLLNFREFNDIDILSLIHI